MVFCSRIIPLTNNGLRAFPVFIFKPLQTILNSVRLHGRKGMKMTIFVVFLNQIRKIIGNNVVFRQDEEL